MSDIKRVIRTSHLEAWLDGDVKILCSRQRNIRDESRLFGCLDHPTTFFRLPDSWLPEYEEILDCVMDDQLKLMREM